MENTDVHLSKRGSISALLFQVEQKRGNWHSRRDTDLAKTVPVILMLTRHPARERIVFGDRSARTQRETLNKRGIWRERDERRSSE